MLENYTIEARIGRGGMAEVFRARVKAGPNAGQLVAIKRMLPELSSEDEYVDMFVSEADLTRQLVHPNVIGVMEAGVTGDGFYMVMEYIDGRDLEQIMRRCQERDILLPVDFACFVAHAVANALHYAHTATGVDAQPLGIVHCDVTPSNVFISSLGEIKLGDFGVAKVGALGPATELSYARGKAHFMAPEQILGGNVSAATDVFSLGAIFYELLTNHKAFHGESVEEVWEMTVGGKAARPKQLREDISEAVERVVVKAIAPRRSAEDRSSRGVGRLIKKLLPEDSMRYTDAEAFGLDLEPLYDPNIGTPLAIAAVVRGLFR